jgi:transcriptional regulator with XRE-family HTH domain
LLLEIDTGVKEAQLLHPGQFGYFALFRKPQSGRGRPSQRMYQMAQLEAVVQAMQRQPDAYLSQASFVTTSRRETFLHEIRSVFVDLDCYTLGLEPDDAFLAKVIDQADLVGIPAPSYVVRSGRGLYAKWLFSQPVGASYLPRWKALQASILSVYRKLGADLKVRDSSRVLRIIGSTNSKSAGSEVEAIYNSGEIFDFEALCTQVGSVDLGGFGLANERVLERTLSRIKRAVHEGTEVSAEAAIEHLTFYAQSREPILLARHTAQGLNWRRFLDMRDLAQQRGGIPEGSRDMFHFWMMSFLAHSEIISVENFFNEARELSKAMSSRGFDPINDGYLQTLYQKVKQRSAGQKVEFRGVKYDPVYTPSNDYLIEVLCITDEEMRSLRTIISSSEKLRRSDAKVAGRSERRHARIQWRLQAMTMLAEGTQSQAEIAARVGVSPAQISRLAAGKLKTPSTVALVLEQTGQSSELEHLRCARGAAPRADAPEPGAPLAGEAGEAIAVKLHDAPDSHDANEAREAAAYAELQRLSRATKAEQEAEKERRRQETEREREVMRSKAVATAQRLLEQVKRKAAACGPMPPTTTIFTVGSADTPAESAACLMPAQEITMTEQTKKTAGGSRSRELLMKARQAKANQAGGETPTATPTTTQTAPQAETPDSSSTNSVRATETLPAGKSMAGTPIQPDPVQSQTNHQAVQAQAKSPPHSQAGSPSLEHSREAEAAMPPKADVPVNVPAARPSPFAQLVAHKDEQLAAAAAVRRHPELTPGEDQAAQARDEGGFEVGTAPRAGIAGSKLTFEELARRGAARKEQLAQAEQALMARPAATLPEDPPWDQPALPAGSRFSEEEWEQAREKGKYHVFEVHVASEAGLVQVEKAPPSKRSKQVVDGKIVERVEAAPADGFIDAVTAEILDGCLLIGPKGQTNYPRAATGRLVYKHPELGDWVYRIIRPRNQAESHAHLATVNAVYWPVQQSDGAQESQESARPRSK